MAPSNAHAIETSIVLFQVAGERGRPVSWVRRGRGHGTTRVAEAPRDERRVREPCPLGCLGPKRSSYEVHRYASWQKSSSRTSG